MKISDFYKHLNNHQCKIEPLDSYSTPRIKITNTKNGQTAFLYGPFDSNINKGIAYKICMKLHIPIP